MTKNTISADDLSGADLVSIFSQVFGGNRDVALTQMGEYFKANFATTSLTVQRAMPTGSGFSVTIAGAETHLLLTPTGEYTGTINLPNATDRQEVLVTSSDAVTTLTLTPQTGDTVLGAPASLSDNGFFRLKYDGADSVWRRVG